MEHTAASLTPYRPARAPPERCADATVAEPGYAASTRPPRWATGGGRKDGAVSLRFKAWLLFGLSFALLIPVVLVILHFTVLRSFARFEESAARRDVERALRAVDAEAGHLETTVMDWAEWDDSYEFMATHRDAYESANLGDDTFRSLELSLMAFVRPSGEVVYGRVYDPQTAQSAELPAEVKRTLADEAAAMHAVGGGLGRRGVLRFADGPRLVAIRRILRSDNSGPSCTSVTGRQSGTSRSWWSPVN